MDTEDNRKNSVDILTNMHLYCERHDGPTPYGGDYSIAYYFNAEGEPCPKEMAKRMRIVEYTSEGERVNEVYGFCR